MLFCYGEVILTCSTLSLPILYWRPSHSGLLSPVETIIGKVKVTLNWSVTPLWQSASIVSKDWLVLLLFCKPELKFKQSLTCTSQCVCQSTYVTLLVTETRLQFKKPADCNMITVNLYIRTCRRSVISCLHTPDIFWWLTNFKCLVIEEHNATKQRSFQQLNLNLTALSTISTLS